MKPERRAATTWVVFVWVCVAAAVTASVRPALAGREAMWLGLGVPYLSLSLLALRRLHRLAALRDLVRFKPGDPTLGVVAGVALLLSAWLVRSTLIPAGSPQQAWLSWLFAQLGDPSRPLVALCLIGTVIAEELVWRGWVQTELRELLGRRRGWVATAVLYALAHAATVVTLSDATAGANPLVVLAALGGGLVWGFLAERTGRLLPGVFAHAIFTYFGADYFRPI